MAWNPRTQDWLPTPGLRVAAELLHSRAGMAQAVQASKPGARWRLVESAINRKSLYAALNYSQGGSEQE